MGGRVRPAAVHLLFYALLLDVDPDDRLSSQEKWEPVFEVGTEPYECPTVEALNRELDAMCMCGPSAVAAGLRTEQRHHLAGELDEPQEEVERRRRAARHAGFVEFVRYWIRPTVR